MNVRLTHGMIRLQVIRTTEKYAQLLVARKQSEILSNTIWISA
jgi:hypothetical protein